MSFLFKLTRFFFSGYLSLIASLAGILGLFLTFLSNKNAVLRCKNDINRLHYCDGCILLTLEEGWSFNKTDFNEIGKGKEKIVIAKNGKVLFSGSLQELEDSEFGKVTWLMAETVLEKISQV